MSGSSSFTLGDVTEQLNQLNMKMQDIGNTVLSLQQAVFVFENKLVLFIMDFETGRLLHFEKLSQFTDACTASESIQNFDLHQQAWLHIQSSTVVRSTLWRIS